MHEPTAARSDTEGPDDGQYGSRCADRAIIVTLASGWLTNIESTPGESWRIVEDVLDQCVGDAEPVHLVIAAFAREIMRIAAALDDFSEFAALQRVASLS